jgi:hypothetical protein
MNLLSTDRKYPVTKCLINGKVYQYEACSDKSESEAKAYYADSIFTKYLGYGTIHSIDGVPQDTTKWYHFFAR